MQFLIKIKTFFFKFSELVILIVNKLILKKPQSLKNENWCSKIPCISNTIFMIFKGLLRYGHHRIGTVSYKGRNFCWTGRLLCESTHVRKLENLCFSTFCELTLAQYISIMVEYIKKHFHVAILMRGLKNMQEIQFALDEFQ